jgi:phage gpG-like protein
MAKSFAAILDDLTRAINALPARVATLAVNFSKERFIKQNWHDASPEPWEKRRGRRRGGDRRQGGAVLVDSGRLKRSIRVISANKEQIIIGTDVPYAEIHNEGFEGQQNVRSHQRRSRTGRVYTVRAYTRRMSMPERRFLGESQELANRIENLMETELSKALQE